MSTLLALLNIFSPLAFLLCALILHELTHVITIYPIAQDVQIVFDNGFDIHYQYENTPFNQTYATLSNLSPSIIGITILLVFSISTTHSYPPLLVSGNLNYLTVGLYLGTIIYSVGGKNDYQLITCDTSP